MSSTPMAIDSPFGANGTSMSKANGVSSVPQTGKLTEMISLYNPVKLFKHPPTPADKGQTPPSYNFIQSINFNDNGSQLITSETDNTMQIYDVLEGRHSKMNISAKYGCNHAMFGHAEHCIIHSSTKKDHKIRYLSAHDNSYIRYFEGHEQNVTCLSLHPGQDNFISCSEDNTLRIWDAASNNPSGILNLTGVHLVAWDPSGNVFAAASPLAQTILLYDFRNFDKEPFATFDILPYCQEFSPQAVGRGWNKLAFSNDGKHLLLGTTGNGHFLLDAFDGHLKAFLRRDRGGARRLGAGDHNPDNLDPSSSEYLHTTAGDCCFTPDGRFVISGSRGKNILVWDTLAATTNRVLSPLHELDYPGETAIVAFNPKYNHFATADQEVLFWVPNTDML
ncbi:hypothetical protein EAE96_004681 [Botrytis aclada]|nr:hypothetical protein EAE96_004681 [Botrytis aclada]